MHMRTMALVASLVLLLQTCLSGCTAAGYAIGDAADTKVQGPGLDGIIPTSEVTLRLADGRWIIGSFVGVRRLPPRAYEATLAVAESASGISRMPIVQGELVFAITDLGGFRGTWLWLDRKGAVLLPPEGGDTIRVELSAVKWFETPAGTKVRPDSLCWFVAHHNLPSRTNLFLDVKGELHTIALEAIELYQVTGGPSGSNKWAGAAIGAGIDVTLVVLACLGLVAIAMALFGPLAGG